MQELDPGTTAAPIATAPATTTSEPTTPIVTAPTEVPTTTATAPAVSETPIARDALRKKVDELEAATPEEAAQVEAAMSAGERERVKAEKKRREEERRLMNKIGKNAPVQPQAPPVESKFPKSKVQRLAELLEKYRRDEITPAQYQVERAKILSDPAPTAAQ